MRHNQSTGALDAGLSIPSNFKDLNCIFHLSSATTAKTKTNTVQPSEATAATSAPRDGRSSAAEKEAEI